MPFSERTLRRILDRRIQRAADRLESIRCARRLAQQLAPWGNGNIVGAFVFGSVAKGTDLIGGADVDLFVSLSSRVAGTLSETTESLFEWLKYEKRYVVRRQNVSLRVHHGSKEIDVVPGKRLNEFGNDHHLWSRSAGSRTKTNIGKQIQHVRQSHRQKEIRLAKIWRTQHGLQFPSFLLELAVIRALHRRQRDRLAPNFETVLQYLATRFARARLTDPGNAANVASDTIGADSKARISEAALASLNASTTALAFGLTHA